MYEISIKELAIMVGKAFGKEINVIPGELDEGSTPRRCPDTSKLTALGFKPQVGLDEGIMKVTRWYNDHADQKSKIKA